MIGVALKEIGIGALLSLGTTSIADGPGSEEHFEYYDSDDPNAFKRSLPSDVVSGEDVSGLKPDIDYPSIDQSIERGPRGGNTST
jgi:hypothetical protein